MTDEQHNFKKIELIGDRVLRLAAVELCNEIIESRYKAIEIIDQLGSTKVFSLIARYKKLTPHPSDPGDKGHSKRMAASYEYSIGALYYEDKVKGLQTAREDLAHFYENQEMYFIKKQA